MPTEADLQRDLQAAMRARDMPRVYVLRGVIAAIKTLKVDKQTTELGEADIVGVMRKELNKRIETIGYAQKADRAETVAENEREKAIIEAYLPPQLGAPELEATIGQLASELGTTQIGPLMSELRKRLGGQFDGKLASEIIRNLQKS